MDRVHGLSLDGPALVHGLAHHVHDAGERGGADGHEDLVAGVGGGLAAHQALGGVHGDAAHGVLAQVLRDLDDEVAVLVEAQRGEDLGELAGRELHVEHRSHDLHDLAGCTTHRCSPFRAAPWAPPSF
jgi:hypothetical protein